MNITPHSSDGGRSWGLIIAVPVCLVLVLFFLVSGLTTSDIQVETKPLIQTWYTPKTARGEDLENKVMVGNCFLCHAYWVGIPNPEVVKPKFVHSIIKLNHGANDRCYNCHLIQDRNKYLANDGSGIMPGNVENMCARCHKYIEYHKHKEKTLQHLELF